MKFFGTSLEDYKSAKNKNFRFQIAKMLLTVMAKGKMAKVSCHQIGQRRIHQERFKLIAHVKNKPNDF